MRIKHNLEVKGEMFAYDGCHKIYILEDNSDLLEALRDGYRVHSIKDLEKIYKNSCELKFISNWKLNATYVGQFEDCEFISE